MRRARCVFPKCGAPTDGKGYRRFVCDVHWHMLPLEEQVRLDEWARSEDEREAAARAYREAADNPTFTYAVDQQCFLIDGQRVSLRTVEYAAQHYMVEESMQVGEQIFSRTGLRKMLEFADSVSGYLRRAQTPP